MKKLILIFSLLAFVYTTAIFAQEGSRQRKTEPTTKEMTKPTKSAKVNFKGTIINITSLATGSTGTVTADEAQKLADKGWPLGLLMAKKVYIVLNADGSYAGQNLAKHAGSNKVGIVGRKKSKSGVNFIIADMIMPVE